MSLAFRQQRAELERLVAAGTDAEVEQALAAFGPPYVVKDDALAAGKGVLVTGDLAAARAHARAYIRALEEMIGAPISAVGVGPRRDQTLQLRPLLP